MIQQLIFFVELKVLRTTLNNPISVREKISVEMVQITWVEDLKSSPKSSRRLPVDTLTTKVAQIKIFTHINFLCKNRRHYLS